MCVQIYGDDDDDDDQLIYRCRCPTCRTLGRFQPNEEFDAAVAALPVGCPYSDDALGTVCSWTGPLQQFSTHPHVFNERPQESESTTESQDSRRRKRDDVADDDVQGPPLKVCRFGRYDVHLLDYNLQVDSSGIHFRVDTNIIDNPTNSPAQGQDTTVDTARSTEHRP